jgi:phosphoadenosine phosphosulfate reductase
LYSYTYDNTTGGILLNSSPTGFSKEPRPVYAPELDLLGFDKYWKYSKQTDLPYMWAEANSYYYRGRLVAKLKGGNIYTAPEIIITNGRDGSPVMPEPNGISLRPINIKAMVEANCEMLEIIEQTTVKKILAVYTKYKDKLDCFHVAFSGGKDSLVLLDLVKKALPKGSFVVVFGDTGMEFPDTYNVIKKIKQQCTDEEIPFYTATSHLTPKESWTMFGPPSRVLRWCCSVHKSAPQVLKLRNVTGKDNFTGLSFIGVRAHESATRAEYEYENFGKKVKGQHDFYPILEWTSAEVFLYIFACNILVNKTYVKGNSRAGCLICPMAGGISEYMRRRIYLDGVVQYLDLIKDTSDKEFTDSRFEDFMNRGAWKSRADGRFVEGAKRKYCEEVIDGNIVITITNPSSNWKEWVKTLDWDIAFAMEATKNGYAVKVREDDLKNNPSLAKIFRQVFRKSAYCRACGVCSANCRNGCISFVDEVMKIDGCHYCLDCHNLPGGCLLYDSLKIPNGGVKMRAINSFTEHAPKPEWIEAFFNDKDIFFQSNSLGPDQQVKFKVFLTDAGLSQKNRFSSFAELILTIGWETDAALGLILINLVAANPQLEWYVKNFDIGYVYTRKNVIDMLLTDGLKDRPANAVAKAYKRIVDTPLGTTLRFGYISDEGEIVRTKCSVTDPRVVLYGLFKFAEKCSDYKEFTLATLLNDSIDRDGISPSRIFGLDRADMTPLLLGLSAKYPDFITASFTHDLEKITLAADKSPDDVLNLFKVGGING